MVRKQKQTQDAEAIASLRANQLFRAVMATLKVLDDEATRQLRQPEFNDPGRVALHATYYRGVAHAVDRLRSDDFALAVLSRLQEDKENKTND